MVYGVEQGSQTQMDLGATRDSKQDLAGRIKKVMKKIILNLVFLINILKKIGKMS